MKSRTLTCIIAMILLPGLTILAPLVAQDQQNESATTATANPVPLINQPLVPEAIKPGGAEFTLIVNGTGFVSGSVVKWNGNSRTTTFVSKSQVKATILSADVAKPGTAWVNVVNPNGISISTSNVAFFEITRPTAAVALMASTIPTGVGPGSLAAGDFNRDGRLDLVVASSGSNNISVLLGNGNGTFKNAGKYGAGTGPQSVAVGDFNGDGKLDLAVVNGGNNTGMSSLSILLGNGDGTFHSVAKYVVSFGNSVAVGDFNRDGKLDLAVANFGSSSVGVFFGNGDGAFKAPINFGAPGPVSVAVGDFNGDGNLDLATANIVSNTGLSNVSVLLGKGDGTFKPAANFGAGSNPSSVAVGDFNGDGKLDIAVANYGGYGNVPSVSVLLGNGNGTFQPAVDYEAESGPYGSSSLAVGDFNGLGRLGLAVGDGASGASAISVLLQPELVSGPDATLEPASLMFPTQLVGTTSTGQFPVLLNNYGTITLSITSITATGDFTETNTCGSSLAPGAGCAIDVSFKPAQGGPLTGKLSVTDDAPGSPQTVSIAGTGTVVEFAPTSLRFGCHTMCHLVLGCHCYCSGPETTTLTNVGRTTLDITDVIISGPFSLANACPANLGPGQSCGLTVDWQRISGNGKISISDNGGSSPQTVPLSGVKQCTP